MNHRSIAALTLALVLSGCIMPIPHRRLHAYGVRGAVVDADSQQAIPAALITRDTQVQASVTGNAAGQFDLPPIHGWHGAFLVGPVGLSLFPGFDMAAPVAAVSVSARGYESATFLFWGRRASGSPPTDWPGCTTVDSRVKGKYLEAPNPLLLKRKPDENTGPPNRLPGN